MSGLEFASKEKFNRRMNEMIERSKSMQAFMNRNIYQAYISAQKNRWMTENASEGPKWAAIDSKYQEWKRIYLSSFPGSQHIMVATGSTLKAVTGGPGMRKVATSNSLTVAIDPDEVAANQRSALGSLGMKSKATGAGVRHAAEERPFMSFGEKTIGEMRKAIAAYIKKGFI